MNYIKNILLKNGFAEKVGGVIYNEKGELSITESTLTENKAHGIEIYDGGGAIYNSEGELTITESTLTGNTAKDDGGAIRNLREKSFDIKNCKLENNEPNDVVYKDN